MCIFVCESIFVYVCIFIYQHRSKKNCVTASWTSSGTVEPYKEVTKVMNLYVCKISTAAASLSTAVQEHSPCKMQNKTNYYFPCTSTSMMEIIGELKGQTEILQKITTCFHIFTRWYSHFINFWSLVMTCCGLFWIEEKQHPPGE